MAAMLRAYRRRAGFTLDELADRTGLTKSYLSKIERGISTPSIAVALAISRALSVDVAHLFSSEDPDGDADPLAITRSTPRVGGAPAESEYVAIAGGASGKSMQPFAVRPSTTMPTRFVDHPGDEFLFVHDGEIELEIPGRLTRLSAGDSAYFDASTPHRIRSTSESGALVVVIAVDSPSAPRAARSATSAHRARDS